MQRWLKPLEHDLADTATALDETMRLAEIGGVDRAVRLGKGGPQNIRIDQRSRFGEDIVLRQGYHPFQTTTGRT